MVSSPASTLRTWVLLVTCGIGVIGQSGDFDQAGPLYQRFSLTLSPGERAEMLGPLGSAEKRGSEHTFGLAPLFSRSEDPDLATESLDVLYPLFTMDRFGPEYRYQFLQVLSLSGGQSPTNVPASRFTLFPFYWQQRSPDAAKDYTAVWPLYGQMRNHIFRDEIRFVLWPAYVQTRKQDVVTDNYLVPFFHKRRGDGLSGWQFWPVVGQERKLSWNRTNSYGETEVVAGHDKSFVLWPFYMRQDTGLGTTNPVHQRVLLPFFTQQRSPARDASTYLFPFGLTLIHDREKGYRETGAPWPLVTFARGEGKTVNRIWPLFSQAHTPYLQSDFYLWPVYKYNRATSAPLDRERTRILFFLYSDLVEKNTETGQALHRTDLWPLFSARRDLEGKERLQLLAVLEPLLPNNKSIERSYSPLWSLWRSEKNPKTGASSQSLIWNLCRWEVTPASRKCSLLFGLIRYESGPAGARWRWFYLPTFRSKSEAKLPTTTRRATR